MTYTPSMIRKLLSDYQRRAQGARPRPRDDVLVQRASPLEEAPWASSSCLWSDIETAMQNLPFQHAHILFMAVCLGEGSWRNGMKRYNWREKVGDYFGISGGDVNKVVDSALEEMCDFLNKPTFNYEREANTVNENDEAVIEDDVDDAPRGLVNRLRRGLTNRRLTPLP